MLYFGEQLTYPMGENACRGFSRHLPPKTSAPVNWGRGTRFHVQTLWLSVICVTVSLVLLVIDLYIIYYGIYQLYSYKLD